MNLIYVSLRNESKVKKKQFIQYDSIHKMFKTILNYMIQKNIHKLSKKETKKKVIRWPGIVVPCREYGM